MKSNLGISLCVLLSFFACFSIEEDTLSKGESFTENQTLVSKAGIFELGFFKTGTNYSQRIYLGIWYKDFPEKTVVWVANRDKSLPEGQNFELKILPNGNLGLYHVVDSLWSTNLMSTLPDTTEAVLLDNGNLILRDKSKPSDIYWQSFDDPTHVWLPGAALGLNRITGRRHRLVSWRNEDDPAPGLYSVELSQENFEFFLEWNMSTAYWKSGGWNGRLFSSAPEISLILGFMFVSNDKETYYNYSVLNTQVFSMLVINPSGELKQVTSFRNHIRKWDTTFLVPKSESEILGFCGAFGTFTGNPWNPCSCLHGFVPLSSMRPNDGCSRKTRLECGNGGSKDGFLEVSEMKFPANSIANRNADSDERCMLDCLMTCSCTAYAFDEKGCSIWEGDLYDLQNVSNNRHILYFKLAGSDLPTDEGKGKLVEVTIAVVVPVFVLVFAGGMGWFYTRRTKRRETKKLGEDLLSYNFDSIAMTTDDGSNLRNRNNADFDLPTFNYASVSAATTKFSPENKLGEGGFGPVYKGKLLNGQEVALKKLSEKSGQGFQEFRNEVSLIAKLQHRNLVRLLGCCIDPNESILIYEYMPNKSLDLFLFDSDKQEILNWTRRVHIIEGIAQGLLYLHEHSRVRIIHRDLKASNILLDGDMNPKISDFGMARIFGGNDSRAHTRRIVGTYGYMAPEYALEGLFSVKSDVFSFGVLVLEIISGKKNTSFYNTHSLNLIRYAWELWISNRGVELVNHKMGWAPVSGALRYINVGLLCVQESPNDRPNMSSVVSMLSSEIAALPAPKQPAFTTKSFITSNSVKNSDGKHSVNGLTVSAIEPR